MFEDTCEIEYYLEYKKYTYKFDLTMLEDQFTDLELFMQLFKVYIAEKHFEEAFNIMVEYTGLFLSAADCLPALINVLPTKCYIFISAMAVNILRNPSKRSKYAQIAGILKLLYSFDNVFLKEQRLTLIANLCTKYK